MSRPAIAQAPIARLDNATTATTGDSGMYAGFRLAAFVVIALIAIAMLYAWFMSLVNWPGIGV